MEKKNLDVLFVQHEEYVKPGEYLNWVERNGCRLRTIRCWEQEEFPQPEKLPDLLVVLGGPQNPGTTREECPYYDAEAEMRLICRCRDAGRMVVGACLGAQLMSEAFGGKFSHSPNREVGPTPLTLTEAGRRDPFLRAFPDRFMAGESHDDMMGMTRDAAVLAFSEGCPLQIVRFGRYLYGFQVHLEFDQEIVEEIMENIPDSVAEPEKHPYVRSPEEIRDFDYSETAALLSSFLDAMTTDYLGGAEA